MQFIPVTIPVELKPELCRKWQFVKRWWNSFFPWTQKQLNKSICLSDPERFPLKMMRKVALVRFNQYSHFDGSANANISENISIQYCFHRHWKKYHIHISDWSGWWDALWWIGSWPHVRFPFHLILHQQQICRPSKTFQFGIYTVWRYQSSNEKAEVEKGDAKDKVSEWRRMQQKVKWRQL